jgi:hypothetical protein
MLGDRFCAISDDWLDFIQVINSSESFIVLFSSDSFIVAC